MFLFRNLFYKHPFFNYNAKVINSAKFRQLIPDFKSATDFYKGRNQSETSLAASLLSVFVFGQFTRYLGVKP